MIRKIKLLLLVFNALFITPAISSSFQEHDSISEPVKVLSRYLQFASYSGREYDAGKYFINVCEANGLYTHVFTDTGGSINFTASLYPLDLQKPNIIFHHHIDVVPEGSLSEWKYPPFSGKIAEGSIWGRGALDIKSLGVMHLFAILRFTELAKKQDLPYNFTILAVSGEETGGYIGSKIIVDNFWDKLNAVLVLGEGGSGIDYIMSASREKPIFGISIAEKTSLWLKLTLDMETLAHGSVTPDEYANKIMIDALSRINKRIPRIKFNKATRHMFKEIGRIQGGVEGFILQNMNWIIFKPIINRIFTSDPNLYALSSNTITITSLNSDKGAYNQIAQRVEAQLDCRLLSNVEDEELINEIHELLNDKRIKVEIIDKGIESFVTIPEDYYAIMKEALKRQFKKTRIVPFFLPASADNNFFRSKNIPVYGIMPVVLTKKQLNSIHNYNEHIPVNNFLKGIDVFEEFIKLIIYAEKNK